MITIYAGKVIRGKNGVMILIASARVPEGYFLPLPSKAVNHGKD